MTTPVPRNALAFKRRLLRWFRQQGRQLPWRATRDPYRITVSEFMLQQTQVSRVVDYYHRFLQRYPTVASLARARPASVRQVWAGLGYYRRAAHLHALARTVIRNHGGTIPRHPAVLTTLPGIGRYTAGAIASFAYEDRVPAVDTNVERVLRRVFTPAAHPGPKTHRSIEALARTILPQRRSTVWEFNQALMDLGATICTARRADCPRCPVRPACRMGQRDGNA